MNHNLYREFIDYRVLICNAEQFDIHLKYKIQIRNIKISVINVPTRI